MSQLLLKGVYYDDDSGGLWFLNNSGSYEEISVGGTTIYTGDGSLSGDREIDFDGHELAYELGAAGSLSIYGETEDDYFQRIIRANFEHDIGISRNNGDVYSAASFYADVDNNIVEFGLSSSVPGKAVNITGNGFDGSLTYIATDSHTFTGTTLFSTHTTGGTGSNPRFEIFSTNSTSDGNTSSITGLTSDISGGLLLTADFNDGTKSSGIELQASAIGSYITYTADTHTFNVGMTITELAGVGTRAIAVDATGKIILL